MQSSERMDDEVCEIENIIKQTGPNTYMVLRTPQMPLLKWVEWYQRKKIGGADLLTKCLKREDFERLLALCQELV